MTRQLIDKLVQDLTPQSQLRTPWLWLVACAGFVGGTAGVILLSDIRPDYLAAAASGILWWKPLLLLGIAGSSLWLVASLSRPAGKPHVAHIYPLLLTTLAVAIILTDNPSGNFSAPLIQQALRSTDAIHCVTTIVIVGSSIFILLWGAWLRKTASSTPAYLGMATGAAAGSLAGAAYALHCPQDLLAYVAVYYGLSIALLTLAGAGFGRMCLRW